MFFLIFRLVAINKDGLKWNFLVIKYQKLLKTLDNYVPVKLEKTVNQLDLKDLVFIGLLKDLWYKGEILLMEMELDALVYTAINLRMRTLN